MSNWSDYYKAGDRPKQNKVTGNLRCVIVDAEEGISKSSGLNMITITVRPSGTKFKVKTWLVQNDKFQDNAGRFFDTFPEIKDGNFNLVEWIGAMGAANFAENDRGYLEVKWWITADRAESLPEFEGERPERQTVTSIVEPEEDPDDLPWV